jgi:hypothetical protein
MKNENEELAIGHRGMLMRGLDNDIWFRMYEQNGSGKFVDYEITHHDCEIVIIDPSAALIRNDAGDFLDYTAESMRF